MGRWKEEEEIVRIGRVEVRESGYPETLDRTRLPGRAWDGQRGIEANGKDGGRGRGRGRGEAVANGRGGTRASARKRSEDVEVEVKRQVKGRGMMENEKKERMLGKAQGGVTYAEKAGGKR